MALTTFVVAALLASASASASASQARAKKPTCPKLTSAQITRTLGFRFVSLTSSTSHEPNVPALDCFYTLARNAGVDLKLYRGSRTFATLKSRIDVNIGTENATADNADPGGCTPAWGQCKGGTFYGHESPLASLGQKALAFPGSKAGGALVMYISKNVTFVLNSDGPYAAPGPDQAQLVAFARLVLRMHLRLAG